jgi:hypothetical protein
MFKSPAALAGLYPAFVQLGGEKMVGDEGFEPPTTCV